MKKIFRLNIQSLDKMFEFIAAFIDSTGLDKSIHFQIYLVVEELFSNMIKYDHKNIGRVELELMMQQNDLIIVLTDFNVRPFDPTKSEKYDISQSLEERPIGKLGIHLVNQIADQIEYQYENNNSIIKLTKHIGSIYV